MTVFQIVGYKNSGKTTLICRLLEVLAQNQKVAVIKHDVHGFDIDYEHTDTYRFRSFGAAATAITSPWRTALMYERESSLPELIDNFQCCDLILVEGFKQHNYPKLVILQEEGDLLLLQQLTAIEIVVLGYSLYQAGQKQKLDFIQTQAISMGLPVFGCDEIEAIGDTILEIVR